MNLNEFKSSLPDFAKDIKLNLGNVLTEEGAPDLSSKQIYLIALAAAYAAKQRELITALHDEAGALLSDQEVQAVKAAVSIMAMNNIYYRFVHLASDKSYATMPAKLRMNVLANSGIERKDFELCSLAVSAINGCGMCMDAHARELERAGLSKLAIQSCIRIAAVINAAAASIEMVEATETV